MHRIYYLETEVGQIAEFYSTHKEARENFDHWIEQGMEPTIHSQDYLNTKKGVCNLLNLFKEGCD